MRPTCVPSEDRDHGRRLAIGQGYMTASSSLPRLGEEEKFSGNNRIL